MAYHQGYENHRLRTVDLNELIKINVSINANKIRLKKQMFEINALSLLASHDFAAIRQIELQFSS